MIKKLLKNKIAIIITIVIAVIALVTLIIFGYYKVFGLFIGGGLLASSILLEKINKEKKDIEDEYVINKKKILSNSYDDTSKQLDKVISRRKSRKD